MAAFQIQGLLVAYKERFDKDNFIKNLLLDNLLLVDIYSRAKKLHIVTDVKRVAIIIESGDRKDNKILQKNDLKPLDFKSFLYLKKHDIFLS